MPPVSILNALADTTRCQIVEILRDGPVPVHRLAGRFPISRPAISRHLRVLKEAGLIKEQKSGRENHYALQPKKLAPVRKWIDTVLPSKPAAPIVEPAPQKAAQAAKQRQPAKPKAEQVLGSAPSKPVSQMGFDF